MSKFDPHSLVYLKSDPAKEPIAVGDSAAATLVDAAHKTDRLESEFELLEISREQYERLSKLLGA